MAGPSGEIQRARATPRSRSSTSPANEALHADYGVLSNMDFIITDDLAGNDAQIQSNLTSQRPSLDEFLSLDGLVAFEDTIPNQHQSLTNVPVVPYEKLDYQSQNWCGWMRRGAALSVVTKNTMVQSKSSYAAILQMERPLAQHNADLVIQSLQSFPAMMVRRETFPWHIHQHSQILSKPTTALPEALSNCMSIAQMFVLRTSETRPFLWRTIRAEYRRLSNEVSIMFTPCSSDPDHHKMYQMSKFELLAAVQACVIYLIMHIIDQPSENGENSPELLLALHASPSLCSWRQ